MKVLEFTRLFKLCLGGWRKWKAWEENGLEEEEEEEEKEQWVSRF